MGRNRIPHRWLNDIEHKRCANKAHMTKCPCGHENDERYLTLDRFSPNPQKIDGLHAYCKVCNNASSMMGQILSTDRRNRQLDADLQEFQKISDEMSHQDSADADEATPRPHSPTATSSDGSSDPFDFLN